jgi:ribonuclease P protein component
MAEPTRRYLFRHRQRLHGNLAFAAVFDARLRKAAGPITVCGRPNGLDYHRLGLSVPRRVGPAVARVRIKRRLREAFRLSQHDWPGGYDLVVVVRPHKLAAVAEYQRLLSGAIQRIHDQASGPVGRDAQTEPGP